MTPLKRRIVELGMTNKEVAMQLGMDVSSFSLIVTGRRKRIGVDKAIQIARTLDSTVEELFGWIVVDNVDN